MGKGKEECRKEWVKWGWSSSMTRGKGWMKKRKGIGIHPS